MSKNFYNIDDVSQIVGEQKHTIRFWESRISKLKVIRTKSGHRLYDYENLLLLKKIKNLNKPIVLIYFSDHGESPFTAIGHDSSKFINEMARIPFLMYFNESAKNLRPELLKRYKKISLKKNLVMLLELNQKKI